MLKRLYMRERGEGQVRETRRGSLACGDVYLLFGISDAILIPDVAVQTITARFVVAILAMTVMEILVATRAPSRWSDITCAVTVGWQLSGLVDTGRRDTSLRNLPLLHAVRHHLQMSANLFLQSVLPAVGRHLGNHLMIFFTSLAFVPALEPNQRLVLILFYISCFRLHVLCELEAQRGTLQRLPQRARSCTHSIGNPRSAGRPWSVSRIPTI